MQNKPKTQKQRVQAIITGSTFWTLEEIAEQCRIRFKKFDTPAAISARWRDIPECASYNKEKRIRPGSKNLWEYRITEKTEVSNAA